MPPQLLSWLRETGRLTVRYILVGFAFVPAGLLYAELTRLGRASVLSMLLCLAFGFVTANGAWRWSALKQPSESIPVISQAWAAALTGPAKQHPTAALIMAETQVSQSLFAQWVTSRVAQRQSVSAYVRSYAVDNQRTSQPDFAQRAGAAHAAFSGIPS
jgi:hypothetical protein